MDATDEADTATSEAQPSDTATATIDTPTATDGEAVSAQAVEETEATAQVAADTADTAQPDETGATAQADDTESTAQVDDDTAATAQPDDTAATAQPDDTAATGQPDDTEAMAQAAGDTEASTQAVEDTEATAQAADDTQAADAQADDDAEAIAQADSIAADQPDVTAQAPDAMTAEDVSAAATSSNTDMADEGTADLAPQASTGNGAAPSESAAEAAVPAVAAPAPRPPRPTYEGPEPTTMEELLNEQATEIRSLKHGDVVEGNVVRIDKDEILVDIGAKSEGVISNRELYGKNAESQPQLNIGDQVLVYVLQPESPEGHAVLSLRRAGLERKWRAMQEQLDAGAIIEAPVIDHNKGGLIVDCGIRGFVPISQIVDFPRRPQNEQPRDAAQEIAEKLQPYVGRKLRLKILEVNRKANRLILSEKVALYEERREKRDELFSSLQVGQKVTGTVRSIAPFGVFVDLGGIDGLVHKSELSWNKVNNPEAGYRVGEEVEAEVIDINHERGRISLSIRRLQPDPWHSTVADLKVGDVIDGTVTKIVNFGAFVRVRDGLEGLIHISELSHARVAHPGDVVHEGQTLKLKVISLDQERHRLGLSLKQAEEAPARPETAATPRERRPRGDRDRSYDPTQAVQEPEGGIDNTLAAAFAQVRQQMEETEALRSTSPGDDEEAEAPAAAEATAEAPAQDETTAEAAQGTAEPATEPETAADEAVPAEAAATTTGEAETAEAEPEAADTTEAEAKPAKKGRASSAKAKAEAAATAEDAAEPTTASAEAPTDAPAEESAEPVAVSADAEAAPEPEPEPATASAETEPTAEAEPAAEQTDPAEGATDAAPAEGADTEEAKA